MTGAIFAAILITLATVFVVALRVNSLLNRVLFKIERLRGDTYMANAQLDSVITQLKGITNIDDSILTYVQSVPSLISAAVSQALANGATPEQLQALTDLGNETSSKAAAIAAAITANTPVAAPVTPPAA